MVASRNRGLAEDTYLDAAHACILDIGVKRTTLTDIARRAGVSRMTLYRSWPDMLSLLGDLMTREWLDTAVAGESNTGDTPAAIATEIAMTVAALHANPLFVKIVNVDPEFLLPYLLHRRGRTQDAYLSKVEERIRRAQRAGSVGNRDSALLAASVVLTAVGFVISAPTVADRAGEDELIAELVILIENYLKA